MTEDAYIKQLESEGYSGVCSHAFEPNFAMGEHTHDQETIHIILRGELVLDEKGKIDVLREGDRFVIPQGTTHTAKAGQDGCTMIVGWKK